MTKKQKNLRTRILGALALYIVLAALDRFFLPPSSPALLRLALYLPPYFLVGWDVLRKAWHNLCHAQAFDESLLMAVATIAAFAIGEYPEATAVMLFYQLGELFQNLAVGRARASISAMLSIVPEYANLETPEGVEQVDPEEVEVGSVIVVKAGERVPLDGTVLSGESFVDTSALTGESVPRRAAVGDTVFSGCVNGEGTLRLRTTKAYEDSTVAKIMELVENASEKKARLEQFITRFARVYTPVVTVSALLLALVPPLLLGQSFGGWIHRACVFLIVSCPCALVISVPLSFFGGIGAASRIGVLVKGGNYLEALADGKTMVFDKTGTLTRGSFTVRQMLPAEGVAEAELIDAAVYAEALSNHPIAAAIAALSDIPADVARLADVQELSGLGVRALWDGRELLSGSAALLSRYGIGCEIGNEPGTVVCVACGGRFLGRIVIADTPKPGAADALRALKAAGVRQTVMLSGDRNAAARRIGAELGIDVVHGELLPADKVAKLEELLEQETGHVVYVGDGINDAPALMRADVGVAMGSLGSDAAIEAADIVLMDDELGKLAATVRIARRTVRIARENVCFALGVKLAVLLLGALGLATMWLAVFGDVGVTVLAVLNAMRCLRSE